MAVRVLAFAAPASMNPKKAYGPFALLDGDSSSTFSRWPLKPIMAFLRGGGSWGVGTSGTLGKLREP